jgi:hypothetical protein
VTNAYAQLDTEALRPPEHVTKHVIKHATLPNIKCVAHYFHDTGRIYTGVISTPKSGGQFVISIIMDKRAHCLVGLMHRHRLSPGNLPTADQVYQHLSQPFPIYHSLDRPKTWSTVSDLMRHHYQVLFPHLMTNVKFISHRFLNSSRCWCRKMLLAISNFPMVMRMIERS